MIEFKNRVFGCAVIKAINSNYNADFSGQPRTLPNGIVYATDKAFKYTIKNYFRDVYSGDTVFYFKSLNEKLNPLSLDETYKKLFGAYPQETEKKKEKEKISKRVLLQSYFLVLIFVYLVPHLREKQTYPYMVQFKLIME